MPARDRQHYTGSYDQRAKAVRAAANADPSTRCRRCGLTLEERRRANPGKRIVWDAGHLEDGNYLSPLVPEHSDCNRSAGARLGNAKRRLPRSEQWY